MNTTLEVIEGVWEEVALQAARFNGHRVRVIVLPDKDPSVRSDAPITYGMFRGDFPDLELADFKIAEFHGDADDGLDWG